MRIRFANKILASLSKSSTEQSKENGVNESVADRIVDSVSTLEPSVIDNNANQNNVTIVDASTLKPVVEAAPEPVVEATPEPIVEAAPEPVVEAAPEPVVEATPEPIVEAAPEPVVEAAPEPVVEAAPEPVVEATPEPVVEAKPEPVVEAKPEPIVEVKQEKSINEKIIEINTQERQIVAPSKINSENKNKGSSMTQQKNVISVVQTGLTQKLDIGMAPPGPGGYKAEEMETILEKMGVPPSRVRYALMRNKLTGEHLSQIMRDFCFLSAENVAKALAIQANLEYFSSETIDQIDATNFQDFKQHMPVYQGFAPIEFKPPKLTLAVADAANISMAANKFYDYKTSVVIASESTIQQVYRKFFASTEQAFDTYLNQYVEVMNSKTQDLESNPSLLRDILGSLLRHACTLKVSDIHMHMTEYVGLIKLTIDGASIIFRSIPKDLYSRLLTKLITDARVKVEDLRGGMKEAAVEFNEHDAQVYSDVFTRYGFRLQLGDAKGGYTAVIRILDRNANASELEHLNFDSWTYDNLIRMSNTSAGLVLITGPTGSGKTTTLYAILKGIDPVSRSIQTIENPVEYRHGLWMQYEISRTAKVEGDEWGKMLKGLLRNAPKVILMGEVRDAETAKTLIEAANTGHLVFTTLHTNTAAMAIARIKKLDVDMDSLAGELLGVLAQRLTRVLCPHCKIDDDSDDTKEAMSIEKRPFLREYMPFNLKKANPRGCAACSHTGYTGRKIVYELLVITPRVRKLIETGASTSKIAETGLKPGYSMWDCGLKLVAKGLTSIETLRLVAHEDHLDEDES